MSIFTPSRKKRWPEGAIVYQIYPRSFNDSNGDGIGDIPGITKKIPYLEDLGINAIWLSPFYPSPMADFGYDVADYCNVDPIFGTLKDMDELIRVAHAWGIKVIVDLVPNHSSDDHPWFRQSKQSRDGKFADWYIWKDPKGKDKSGKPLPPNNWLGIFDGETAWEWVPARQQFYLHSFDVRQPDLNWSNPEVREAFKDVMRFWLGRGVDGFRVDAVRFMGKDPLFRNNPKNPKYKSGHGSAYGSLIHKNSQGGPQLYGYLAEMAAVLKEKPYRNKLRFMVTESYPEEPIEEYLMYYQSVDAEVAAPFNFEGFSLPWRADRWKKFLNEFHKAIDEYSPYCVASYAFGNHDQHRLATRRGEQGARSAAVLLLTLPGMPFIYNGEEIGMKNGHIPEEFVQDPGAEGGSGRDPERTPLQWTAGRNAGFSLAESTWLPLADDYPTRNVDAQLKDKHSFLSLYKSLCKLRNKSAAMHHGTFELIETSHEDVLGFTRLVRDKGHVILINFSKNPADVSLPKYIRLGQLQISSSAGSELKKTKNHQFRLHANEAAIFSAKKFK